MVDELAEIDGIKPQIFLTRPFSTFYESDGTPFMLTSPLGNSFMPPNRVLERLPKDLSLDCELYGGRSGALQFTMFIFTKVRSGHWKNISFEIFDIPSRGGQPFKQLYEFLQKMFGENFTHATDQLYVVHLEVAKDRDHGLDKLREVECSILRKSGSVYEVRISGTLLKVKTFDDLEALPPERKVVRLSLQCLLSFYFDYVYEILVTKATSKVSFFGANPPHYSHNVFQDIYAPVNCYVVESAIFDRSKAIAVRNVALAGLRLPGDNERLFDVDADALYRESFLRKQFSLLRRADVDLAILGSAIALARNNTSGVICRVADVTDHLPIPSEKLKRLLWDLSSISITQIRKGELCFLHGASLNFLFHENRFGHFSTDPSTRRQERPEPPDYPKSAPSASAHPCTTHNEDADLHDMNSDDCDAVQMFYRAQDVVISGGQFNAAHNMDIRNNLQGTIEANDVATSSFFSSNPAAPSTTDEPSISPGLLTVINGGQHNTAGRMKIDNSRTIHANTQAIIITNFSLYRPTEPAHLANTQAPKTIEQPDHQSARTKGEVGSRSSEGDNYALERSHEDRVDDDLTLSVQREPEFENRVYEQPLLEIIRISSVFNQQPVDHAILEVLSKYPSEADGLATFKRIVTALLFSYSPLSIGMISALFLLSGPEEVLKILRPAAQLLILPSTGDGEKWNDCWPVRFVDSKVVEFFIDRGRSGKYFTDAFTAHRTLCNACEMVKNEVHRRGIGAENLGPGWPDAYNYALLNYEDHRGAAIGTQSKL